jgi:D-alanyl-lipoteichoic acid acyltransferase DltB (MBOAT superfamily)
VLFNSLVFAAFAAVVYPVWGILRGAPRRVWLLAASLFFYGWWDWRFLGLLLFTSLLDWVFALRIEADRRNARAWVTLSVVSNLGVLGTFKYLGFFVTEAQAALVALGIDGALPTLGVLLPMGLSFYTFQAMAYTIDVYRGDTRACRNPLDFLLFISFFPQLVAGPLERSAQLLPQLRMERGPTPRQLAEGAELILWGFVKKLVVADNLAPLVEATFDREGSSGLLTWLGVYAFTWQIYCDFSGYSDMARGFARWFGVELMVNFDKPFLAASPREIWRRWHISLSRWLRDYLYVPLGGNRSRVGRNLLLTMLLGGLWHGANWTFLAWGAWHGLALAIQRKVSFALPKPLAIVATFHFLVFGFIWFRAPNLDGALRVFGDLASISWRQSDLPWLNLFLFLTVPLLCAELWSHRRLPVPTAARAALIPVGVLSVVLLGASQGLPFVYFQF